MLVSKAVNVVNGWPLLLLTCVMSSACTLSHMEVHESVLARSDGWTVERPSARMTTATYDMKFGPYLAKNVDQSNFRKRTGKIDGGTMSKGRQWFSFTLLGGVETIEVSCKLLFEEEKYPIVYGLYVSKGSDQSECTLKKSDGSRLGEVIVNAIGGGDDQGQVGGVLVGDRSYAIIQSHQIEGGVVGSYWVSGYRFEEFGAPLAAVDVLNKGKVYIPRDIDKSKQDVLAASSVIMAVFADLQWNANERETL